MSPHFVTQFYIFAAILLFLLSLHLTHSLLALVVKGVKSEAIFCGRYFLRQGMHVSLCTTLFFGVMLIHRFTCYVLDINRRLSNCRTVELSIHFHLFSFRLSICFASCRQSAINCFSFHLKKEAINYNCYLYNSYNLYNSVFSLSLCTSLRLSPSLPRSLFQSLRLDYILMDR